MSYEKRWLEIWDKKGIFQADPVIGKKKVFVTFPYPYMNGPVHVGTAFTSLRVDIYARFKRMQGYNVLFPWAWHWTGQSIVGLSYRIKMNDENAKKALIEIDGVPENEIEKFTDPQYLAQYYTNASRDVIRRTGYSIDWRREFTTIDPAYQRFVEWQYITLRNKGYVVQSSHPVVWCPNDKSPTGDHDRMEGVGASPEEFSLVKFQLGEFYLVAATLRPETIYGATNIWVKPDDEYVEVKVDNEPWIISSKAVAKIADQKHDTKVQKTFKGIELLGKYVIAPLTGKAMPILPARFVDPELGTGIVYSVPAHAPYDFMALEDIKNGIVEVNDEIKKIAEEIQPIQVVSVKGYSEIPTKDIVTKFNIRNSVDEMLTEATSRLYRDEFHYGIIKNSGPLNGMKVPDAKQKAVELLKKTGRYSTILDLPEKVVCRCGTRCYVKILENQWFLNYSNKEWKQLTKELIDNITIFPEESREWYYKTIEWLEDKACVRRSGMGTRLPWDKEWIVETLSDSTIYPAFYTISKYVNQERIHPEKLKPAVFDYIFLGKGKPERLAKEAGINEKLLKRLREEFLYWYPVDLRNSAKELIPNHLTFFAFHHAAIFDRKLWPKCISVNGMVQIEGSKMSKTKGKFVTWRSALEKYGADTLRLALSLLADGMEDANWSHQKAEEAKQRLESIIPFIKSLKKRSVQRDKESIDEWLISVTGRRIRSVMQAIEQMKIRKAASEVFMEVYNDIRWYLRRATKPRRQTIDFVINAWVKMMSPFTPFIAEEINKILGSKSLVCLSQWPNANMFAENELAEISEIAINRVLEDSRNVLRLFKEKKKSLKVYVADKSIMKALIEISEGKKTKGEIAKRLTEIGIKPETLFSLRYEIGDDLILKISRNKEFDEFNVLKNASDFLSRELGVKVDVKEYSPEIKNIKKPLPLKPALLFE